MSQPIPPDLAKLKASPHWHALEPIVKTGFDDARRGTWDNQYPEATLRWFAYEEGHDQGSLLNQKEELAKLRTRS